MKLYEFLLPMADNSGEPTGLARTLFLHDCLTECNGYTQMAVATGAWRDTASGKRYYDYCVPVRIAGSPAQRDLLIERAFQLFSDQLAIFVAEIGEATIYERAITKI